MLEQNYPDQFNPTTVLEFFLPEEVVNAKLLISNELEEKIPELINTTLTTDKYNYSQSTKGLANGIYFYELRTDNFVACRKRIFLNNTAFRFLIMS